MYSRHMIILWVIKKTFIKYEEAEKSILFKWQQRTHFPNTTHAVKLDYNKLTLYWFMCNFRCYANILKLKGAWGDWNIVKKTCGLCVPLKRVGNTKSDCLLRFFYVFNRKKKLFHLNSLSFKSQQIIDVFIFKPFLNRKINNALTYSL